MTREEAIQALKKEKRTALHENKVAFDMAIQALEQELRWIPTSERLPKEGKEVLVSGYDTYNKKVIISRYQGEQYGFTCGLASAWMPLPTPYKSQESEKI